MINKQRKSIYPEYEHIQLLKACLLKGSLAIEAWRNWDSATDINDIDNASMRLLPSLYLTLRENNIHPDYIDKIKGVYRRTLVKNKILLQSTNDVIKLFQKSNIEVMLLKGGALILQKYYKDPYQRPMSDIDLLIKPHNIKIANDLLVDMGWESLYKPNKYSKPIIGRKNYYKKPNMEIDLHWYIMYEGPDINCDSILWESSKKIIFKNITVTVLNPSYQLMHVCIHGVIWGGSYPLRWITDAMLIFNSKAKIDWQEILDQTKTRRLTIPMYTSLNIINNIFDISVPGEIMQKLKDSGTVLERIWYYLAKRKPFPLFGRFIQNYFLYKLFFNHRFTFPGWFRYMQHIYNADSLISLPWTIIKKIGYNLINYRRIKPR